MEAETMRIEYVTHASLLLKSNGLSFLTDPFFFPELDPVTAPCIRNFPPREIVPADFGRIDFLFSSHEHDDHCQRESLAALKDQVETAVIPAERSERRNPGERKAAPGLWVHAAHAPE